MRWATSDQIRDLLGVEAPGLLAWDPSAPMADATVERLGRAVAEGRRLRQQVEVMCAQAVRVYFHPPPVAEHSPPDAATLAARLIGGVTQLP